MNKLQTEKLTETTKESLERTGYALVGLGAYIVDAARSKEAPDVLTDAGQALLKGFERVEHRGRSAWPRARKAADQATDEAKKRAKDTSDQVKSSAEKARQQANDSIDKARAQATETGEQMRDQVVEALKFVRNVAEAKTGIHPNYAEMTKDELYERAQDLDIEGRSDMDKDQLVQALRREDNPDFASMTKEELYELASEVDIDGRSKMSKAQLVKALNAWLAEKRDLVNA